MRLRAFAYCRVFYHVMTLNMVIHSSEYSVILYVHFIILFFRGLCGVG